jgi:hypothetical protein
MADKPARCQAFATAQGVKIEGLEIPADPVLIAAPTTE